MKKYAILIITVILFVFNLSGCGEKHSYETTTTTLNVIVVECKEGTYYPDTTYRAMANMYLAQGNQAMWSSYMFLANANGTYDYNVTVNIGGNNYVVIREEFYDVGNYITVIEEKTYQDSKLIKTEYK